MKGVVSGVAGNCNPQAFFMFKVPMASLSAAIDEPGSFEVRNELPDLAGRFCSIAMIL
jgi:hypothetical protein